MRRGLRDEAGEKIEWASVIRKDVTGTKATRQYKQVALFNLDDFESIIRDRKQRIQEFRQELHRFCKLALARFGKRIQKRFDFDLNQPEA